MVKLLVVDHSFQERNLGLELLKIGSGLVAKMPASLGKIPLLTMPFS